MLECHSLPRMINMFIFNWWLNPLWGSSNCKEESSEQAVDLILHVTILHWLICTLTFSPTSDGSAAAILASEEFVKKHGLESKAVEILGMEMATDLVSTFQENSSIKVVIGKFISSYTTLKNRKLDDELLEFFSLIPLSCWKSRRKN